MTTFYIIRHGERDLPPDILPGRLAGVGLTEKGRAQAQAIARHLRSVRIDQVLSSPLERALETAAPLAREKGLPVQAVAGLNELDFGRWTGARLRDLEQDETWMQFNRFRSATRIPGGESALEAQHRFVAEVLRVHAVCPEQHVACFSHADPIRFALTFFLGMPLDHFDRLEIEMGSVTQLAVADWGVRLVRVNEVPCA